MQFRGQDFKSSKIGLKTTLIINNTLTFDEERYQINFETSKLHTSKGENATKLHIKANETNYISMQQARIYEFVRAR